MWHVCEELDELSQQNSKSVSCEIMRGETKQSKQIKLDKRAW